MYHFLALARARFALALVGVFVVQVILFAVLHAKPAELVGVQIGVSALSVQAAEAWYLLKH
jgi:hypothetical protein